MMITFFDRVKDIVGKGKKFSPFSIMFSPVYCFLVIRSLDWVVKGLQIMSKLSLASELWLQLPQLDIRSLHVDILFYLCFY